MHHTTTHSQRPHKKAHPFTCNRWSAGFFAVCASAVVGLSHAAPPPPPVPADGVLPQASSAAQAATPELAARWWQWAMASPRALSPVADRTGERCAVGQSGNIWFLAGSFNGSPIQRRCVVPAGKMLFFPIINMVRFAPAKGNKLSCAKAKAEAALNNDTAIDLFATLDGQPMAANLKQHRISSSKCFNVFAHADWSGTYNSYPSATDGYWLLLKPLPPGRHLLKFGGKYNNNSAKLGHLLQDISYELIVE